MTNPNNQTNGASLEDCHTNFFALTDLSGIKWRKVVWSGEWSENSGEVLEDPVLAGYVRCIAADILCVWRRVAATPRPIDPPHVFLDQLLPPAPPPPPTPHHPPLSLQTAKELWIFWYGEQPDLTNLISPDLLNSDGGEQGSWENGLSYECRSLLFKALHNLIERCLLSRDFVRLGKWYIQPYDSNEKILEKSGHLSFAFDFFVHGESHVCASVDVRQHPPVRTLLAKHLQQAHASLHSSPPVQVILAPFGLAGTLTGQSFRNADPQTQRLLDSWRQFYPIDKGLDNAELPPAVEVVVGGVKMRYPTSYVLITDLDESTASLFNNQMSVAPTPPPPKDLYRGPSLAEQVWHECCISSGTNGGSNGGSSGGGDAHPSAPAMPSSPAAAPSGQWNFVDPMRKQTCSCACKSGGGGGGSSSSGGGGVESSESGAVCSPSSVAGSPGAANSIPPPDPAMPTLSPQPPPAHHPSPATDKVVPTPTDFSAPKSVSSISNQMLSPYGGEVVGSVGTGKCLSAEGKGTPPVGRIAPPPPASTPPPNPCPTVPKRPSLSTLDYEDAIFQELHPSPLLYDYSTLEAWLNHPVKRFKPQPSQSSTVSPQSNQQQQVVPQLQSVFKQEPSIDPSPKMEVDNCGTGPGDPYEFDDESAANRVDNFRTTPIPNIKEEDKGMVNGSVPMQTQISNPNLFTNEALAVNFNDLDQIFEHSEEQPAFDALQVPTPPNPEGGDGLVGLSLGCTTVSSRGGILRPEELSKMFPTPPSLEHIPVSSPITSSLFTDSDFTLNSTMGSPNHEPITDWSYVYKPPEACKFVGPSRYAPLTTLPSHSLPPVTLPSNLHYKPTWATYLEKQQSNSRNQQQLQQQQVQSATNIQQPPSVQQVGTPRSIPEPSPSPGWGGPPSHPMPSSHHMMQRQAAPPPPYSPSPYHKMDLPPSPPRPEANSLVVTVLLGDSALNIFRDHNFDSCTFCVCNAGPKVVGNIKGGDAGVYLPGMMGGGSPFMSPSPHMLPPDDEPIRCNCGFSAVVNRRLSYKAGLFIEDELEITGVLDDNSDRDNDKLTGIVMELMRDQCLVPGTFSNAVVRAAAIARPLTPPPGFNILALRDATALSSIALEQGRIASLHTNCKIEMDSGCVGVGRSGVHRWCFLRARGPSCNQDIIRVMKQLQPILQDAILKKCGAKLWEAPSISGPLTWRQFHRLAGRVTDDRSGPQPIPSLLVGRDKDWISLSPYAIHMWEKLLLEPYSYSRDVAYIVVAPDNDFVLHKVKHFFRELSSMYEVCKLGRHFPITKILRDGILRVGKSASQKLSNEPLDDWFQMLSDSSTTNMLKLYAQVCRYHLAPHLSTMVVDKTLLEQSNDKPQPSPRTPSHHEHQEPLVKQEPTTEENQSQNSCSGETTPTRSSETTATPAFPSSQNSLEDEDSTPPHIVIYLIEPFSVGSDDPDLQKLSCIAMLRVYNTVLQNIPEPLRTNLQLQVISLESIVELSRGSEQDRRIDHMRSLALSVFNQCKRLMQHTNTIKTLTGFGTVASNELFLKNKDEKNKKPYKVYQPAYILAEKHKHAPIPTGPSGEVSNNTGAVGDKCCVLYVTYCLSEDQRWLLAAATDDSGLLLDTVSINIHIPNRSRRRKASARRQGLPKLMDFILGLMSQSVVPWRLVVSRVGRIGHGELKGWSWLLSRKQLLKASKQLKEMCVQCSVLYPNDVPCILSACLVSLEPDSALRLMPDQFTPDERFSQASTKCHLSTPADVSSTHILVFPTSATTQSSQSVGLETNLSDPELGDDELLMVLPDDMPEGMGDFNDIFSWPENDTGHGGRSPGSPTGGKNGSRSQPASPTQQGGPVQSSIRSPFSNHNNTSRADGSEEVGTLLQQPLALGYLVSTAPTGRMPRWFWSACPHLEAVCPAFLKNALHLHSTAVQNSDELLSQQSNNFIGHPLDSQVTTDVLRYVLEGYNALSWLALDANNHDRLSCLPVHIQILMQLYHMTSALS